MGLLLGLLASSMSGGGGSYPGLTMTGDAYTAGALSAGSGTGTVVFQAGIDSMALEAFVHVPSTPAATTLFSVTDSSGNVVTLLLDTNRTVYMRHTNPSTDYSVRSSAVAVGDHHFALGWKFLTQPGGDGDNRLLHFLLDGVDQVETDPAAWTPQPGTATVAIAVSSGITMHDFRVNNTDIYTSNFTPPSSPLSRIGSTLMLCHLTSSGVGS